MKTFFTSFLILIAVLDLSAQEDDYNRPKSKLKPADRISASVSAGTSVSFSRNTTGSSFSTFIAPTLKYKLTERFSVTGGLFHYNLAPNSIYSNRTESIMNNTRVNSSGNLVFAGAEYKLNKKLLLSGAMMVDAQNKTLNRNNYKALSLGMDYKLSEHSSIGFRATVSEGSTDYMFDPARGTYNYNPVLGNSFGNAIGGFGQWGADELNRIR
ncbi:MAG: hypothetical protein K0Q95_2483 [Bacteroidota bacterium]|jgi:hypothetical protein|nr:hypothetical protein [Bacteroidota bacterium]